VTRPVRPPRTGVGRLIGPIQAVPGGRAVLFGFFFAVVAAGMLLFAPITPRYVQRVPSEIVNKVRVDNDRPVPRAAADNLKEPRFESTYLTNVIGPAAGAVVIPVLIAGSAVLRAKRPNRARSFTFAAVAQMVFVLFLSGLGIFFMFSAGGLGFGAFQARKAEGPPARRSWRRQASSDATGDEDDDDAR
jgi:hypothetical protein